MKVRTFYSETFGFVVHLVVGCRPKEFRDYVRKTTKPKYKNPGKFTGICHVQVDHVIIGLASWSSTAEDIGTLSHEIFHAAFKSLHKRDTRLSHKTEEVFAYLYDELLRRSLQALGVK